VDQEIAWLVDRTEIRELTARYGRFFDDGDTESFAATFTEDGSMEVNGSRVALGRKELADMCANTPWGVMHVTVDPTIEVDGDKAVQEVTILVVQRAKSMKEPSRVVGSGRYTDELVRTSDGWRFARRTVVLDGWEQH
jgi:uncharacterized protein (TIGR02246 family)